MASRSCRVPAGLLCVALAVGCTGGSVGSAPGSSSPSGSKIGAEAAGTAAAELRAGLTYVLTAHVFAVGNAAQALVSAKGDLQNPGVRDARATLDANATTFASVLTGFSTSSREPFLAAWKLRTELLLDYAAARAVGDAVESLRLRAALVQSTAALAQLIHGFILPLPAQTLRGELSLHLMGLLTAIDALAAHRVGSASKLGDAAALMPRVAALLATGIASDRSLQ